MRKIFFKILVGIFSSLIVIGAFFYIMLFLNLFNIYQPNHLKWIPILAVALGVFVSGKINKETPSKWLFFLMIPLVILKPFNYFYFPFIIVLVIVSAFMLVITRSNQKLKYQRFTWLLVGVTFGFFLFKQPLVIKKEGFGYDKNGNIENALFVWDFSSKEDKKLPSHILFDVDNKQFNFDSLKSKVYFITFWATWCEPCLEKKDKIEELKNEFASKSDVEFIDVSFDTDIEEWKQFITNNNSKGIQLISKDNQKTSRDLDFSGLPMYFIVNKEGFYKKYRVFEIAQNIFKKEVD